MLVKIGQLGRIVTGEACVAIAWACGIALRFTQGPIQTFNGQESEAVGMDIVAHLGDVHPAGEQLFTLGGVDAIEAAVGRRRAGDAHMHFFRPGLAHHLHDLQAGGAAHD
jgi:hypothetical protein